MTFEHIADGAAVYLDANIIIYDFNGVSRDCSRLMQRCKEERVYGLISTLTLAEVCHRAMCEEARQRVPESRGAARYLKKHPDLVRVLRQYSATMDELIQRTNLGVIEITEQDLLRSQRIREEYGLLTNDSITAHVVLEYGIPAIATNDADFDGVEGFQVFRPGDLS